MSEVLRKFSPYAADPERIAVAEIARTTLKEDDSASEVDILKVSVKYIDDYSMEIIIVSDTSCMEHGHYCISTYPKPFEELSQEEIDSLMDYIYSLLSDS